MATPHVPTPTTDTADPTRPRPPLVPRGPQPDVDSTAEVDIRDFLFPPDDDPAFDARTGPSAGKPKKR